MNTQTPQTISIVAWWKPGNGMMYETSALDPDHPMHPYNQVKTQGLRPEDYGLSHPRYEEFDKLTREELIDQIVELRKEVEGWARFG